MQVKTKEEAIKRLTAIEKETKELRKIIDPPINIIERMKTIEDACEATGKNYKGEPDEYKQAEKAIEIFAEALREGKNENECWYYPYFSRSSGGEFSLSGYGSDSNFSCVGAHLRVDTPEKARHIGNCMLPFYKTYHNGK
jgi:hypothetical protein